MKRDIVALIPVREGSQRVRGKNFIPFADNKSLLQIKIDHCQQAGCFDHVYVSSDSQKAQDVAQAQGAEFLKRDARMCRSDVPWAEVVEHIMQTIPGDPLIVWALTTSPFFSDFAAAVKQFCAVEKEYDSLVAVLPKKSFFLNQDGHGINYSHGYWHPNSQQLETYYEVTGACYIGLKSNMLKWKYWFGPKPYLYAVRASESLDVDTQEDFEFAQKLYKAVLPWTAETIS